MKRMYLILGLCLGLNALQASQLTKTQEVIIDVHATAYCIETFDAVRTPKQNNALQKFIGSELTAVDHTLKTQQVPTDDFNPEHGDFILNKARNFKNTLEFEKNDQISIFQACCRLPERAGLAKCQIAALEGILPTSDLLYRDERFLVCYSRLLEKILEKIK